MATDYGKKVIDGVIQYESASGMTTGDPSQQGGCLRKWHNTYVGGMREPFVAHLQLGDKTHKEIEHHLKTGEMTLGHLAMSAQHLIPEPDPRYVVELLMQPTVSDNDGNFLGWPGDPALPLEGVRTVGHIDLYRPWHTPENLFPPGYQDYLDNEGELCRDPDFTVEVEDWKTSSDIGKWAKMGPDLIKTIQMPLYAKFATKYTPGTEYVRISHVYMQTKGAPRAHKSSALLDLRQIEDRWEQMGGVMRTLKDVAKETDPNKVPANLNACGAYKGCMHAGTVNCQMNQDQQLDQIFGITKSDEIRGEKTMSLIDDIKKLEGLQAEPVAPAAPALDAATADFKSDWDALLSINKGTPPLHGDAVQAYAKMTGDTFAAGSGIAGSGELGTLKQLDLKGVKTIADSIRGKASESTPQAPPVQVTPPNTPPPASVVEVAAPAPKPAPAETAAPSAPAPVAPAQSSGGNSNPAANPGDSGSDKDAAVTKALACRAKGSFSTMRKDEMALAFGAMADAVDSNVGGGDSQKAYDKGFLDGVERAKSSAPKANVPAQGGFKLFIDCVASCPTDRLDDYVRKVCAMLEEQAGCKDIRCSNTQALDFGKWKGALAACVRATPPEDGNYVIGTDDEITQVVAQTLKESASVWLQGVK